MGAVTPDGMRTRDLFAEMLTLISNAFAIDKMMSKAAIKNKKKRDNKKNREPDVVEGKQQAPPSLQANGSPGTLNNDSVGIHGGTFMPGKSTSTLSPSAPPFTPSSQKSEIDKKIKTLYKKLQGWSLRIKLSLRQLLTAL